MDNPFSQPKLIYKLTFSTFHKNVRLFETFFSEEILGISAFEQESQTIEAQDDDKWKIEVYFSQKQNEKTYIDELLNFAIQHDLKIICTPYFQVVEDKDWVSEYQKQLSPINIGNFFISSLAQASQKPKNSIPIILEASRAFGSGEHSTTSGCLEAIDYLSDCDFDSIYDIGTGSGILSFAASKIWPNAKIVACDIEETSIEVANFNQKFNDSKIHFYQNSLASLNLPIGYKKFDLIISNILALPLIELAPKIKDLLHKNSKLILSGFLDYQMNQVIEAYLKMGIKVQKIIEKQNWIILILKVKAN